MKKYIKTYKEYFDYCDNEPIVCEWCCREQAVDIHHIVYKSKGGKDTIENLIGLCRNCHELAHKKKISKEDLQGQHKSRMEVQNEFEEIKKYSIKDLPF